MVRIVTLVSTLSLLPKCCLRFPRRAFRPPSACPLQAFMVQGRLMWFLAECLGVGRARVAASRRVALPDRVGQGCPRQD
eukprot:10912082-Alexandrium_andersonii.AAC.1